MNKEPRPHYAFWFGLLGFILGLGFVALATVIALFMLNEEITISNIIAVHSLQTGPLFWLIDSIPFISAILFAFIGSRQNRIVIDRYQYARAIRHRDAEIRHLNSVLAKQDEAVQCARKAAGGISLPMSPEDKPGDWWYTVPIAQMSP